MTTSSRESYHGNLFTRLPWAFPGVRLVPEGAQAQGRMQQVISIVDSYGYWPMVRRCFRMRRFALRLRRTRPRSGRAWLVGDRLSLADLHLGPMMAYCVAARDGAAMLADFPRLTGWWGHMRGRGSMVASDPGLPLRGEGR